MTSFFPVRNTVYFYIIINQKTTKNKVKTPTEEQRLKIYRHVRAYLKRNGKAGFCKGFNEVAYQNELSKFMVNRQSGLIRSEFRFDACNNDRLRTAYPEIAKRKPRTWYMHGSSYWFDPNGNRKASSPRIRILTEAIKELGGE